MINDYILGPDTDHYDAEECFDDVAPKRKEVPREAQVAAAREIVRQAQVSRLPAPFLRVEPSTGDVGDVDMEDVLGELLGVIEDDESTRFENTVKLFEKANEIF